MSVNQSRGERNESQQRKPGRSANSAQHRSLPNAAAAKGGAAAGGSAPPPSSSAHSSGNRSSSFKKSNGQGGQSRVNPSSGNSESTVVRTVQNGTPGSALPGTPDGIISGTVKPIDSSVPKSVRALPKAPSSQTAAGQSDSVAPATARGDASRAFPLQFGTINPCLMNGNTGMQIPARTSSAPPNLDEQKRDQARHDSFRAVPTAPIPSGPKQSLPRKDSGINQSNAGQSNPSAQTRSNAPAQITAFPSATQKPSVIPHGGLPVTVPYQQPQVTVHFSGPSPQIQSIPTSLQTHLPMTVGNASQVQPPVFVPALQSHSLQSQAFLHQGQSLGFTPQLSHQMAPQLGSMGISIPPQFAQQQASKFGGPRKVVKITDPKTHEEVRIDKRTDSYSDVGLSGPSAQLPRSHPNLPPQSQPISSFPTAHQMNYYSSMQPNSYSPSPTFFPTQTSLPLTSTQMTQSSSAQRYNFPLGQGGQTLSFMTPALHTIPVNKTGPSSHGHSEPVNKEPTHDSHAPTVYAPTPSVKVTVKPAVTSSSVSRSGSCEVSSESSVPLPASLVNHSTVAPTVVSIQRQSLSVSSPDSVSPTMEMAAVAAAPENKRREPIKRSDSWKDQQKKQNKKEQRHPPQQPQAEGSVSAGGSKSSSLKISKDIGSTDLDVKPVVKSSDCMQATLDVVGVSASLSTLPPNLEISADVRIFEAETMSVSETSPATSAGGFNASEAPLDCVQIKESSPSEPSNLSGFEVEGNVSGNLDTEQVEHSSQELGPKQEATGAQKHIFETHGVTTSDNHTIKEPVSLSAPSNSESGEQTELVLCKAEAAGIDIKTIRTDASKNLEFVKRDPDQEALFCSSEVEASNDLIGFKYPNSMDAEVDAHTNKIEDFIKTHREGVAVSEFSGQNQGVAPPDLIQKHEGRGSDSTIGGSISNASSISKDRPSVEQNRVRGTVAPKKKKRKEIISRADAAGATSDLYTAYKTQEEKHETAIVSESTDIPSGIDVTLVSTDELEKDVLAIEEDSQSKGELDDWEDAAEITSPKLKASENGEEVHGTGKKRYSRDFILTFSDYFTDLPADFVVGADIADAIMSAPVAISPIGDRELHSNSGRIVDRRLDRRGSGLGDDDRWNKLPGPLGPGHGGPAGSFRPGQGASMAVLRNLRGQVVGQYGGGILPGPAQSMSAQGGMVRNSSDADRWQRASGSHKGLIPSPHSPLQMMHKAGKKYEVGKVSDKEEAKQRQLKGILNKLTPQNFDKLFEQVKEVNIDNVVTLTGVISQIFDKALMEPTFCEMYANFCSHLAGELPDFVGEDNEKITFKRLLLNKCQEEFERGEREQAEADRIEEDGEVKRSVEEREEKRIQARRRMLGNIRLIGELYKKKMLTERIMHECIKKLLGQYQNPDEEDVEALCKLMSTIGEIIDHPKAKEHMDAYFERMQKLSSNQKLSSRVRFMLKDAIDLRRNRWRQRRKIDGPKKIEEVHRDAAQERQLQVGRMSRGSSVNMSARRGQPLDFGPRGSVGLPSPGPQPIGVGFRGLPLQQVRGFGGQDVRFEDRHSFENRTSSVPLPQRPIDDDSITLGPQGGLARGMSTRGQLPISSGIISAAPNGYGSVQSVSDWPSANSREELIPRAIPDRFSGASAYDQSNFQDRVVNRDHRNSDRLFDRSTATVSAPGSTHDSLTGVQNASLDTKLWPEERLREMSITAIREFYSANDEAEVASCIKDLNSPNFYPTMVSLWVTDSFERKDIERDLLAKLLVNLCKSRDSLIGPIQLIKGFEFVFSILEDAVYDAPKAAEFLGRILAQVIVENIVSLKEIGRLIREGGEEPGRLRQIGLASDVLGGILEMIRKEKGESRLNEIRTSSNLRLEDFQPPDPNKSRKLDAFI